MESKPRGLSPEIATRESVQTTLDAVRAPRVNNVGRLVTGASYFVGGLGMESGASRHVVNTIISREEPHAERGPSGL